MRRPLALLPLFAMTFAFSASAQDGGTPDAGPPATDAGTPTGDAGTPTGDAGTPTGDAGTPIGDAGPPVDGGAPADGGMQPEACDPATFEPICTGAVATFCDNQTQTTFEVDCATLFSDVGEETGLDSALTCGSVGCVEAEGGSDCSILEEPTCLGPVDGLCRPQLSFVSPANLSAFTPCSTGQSCASTYEATPNDPGGIWVNRCFESFGTCMPGQVSGPCAESVLPGENDTMTFCERLGVDAMGIDLGTVPDLTGWHCRSFSGGICSQTADGTGSTCTFDDNSCFSNFSLYGCDPDRDGVLNGSCDYGVQLPEAAGGEGREDGTGDCVEVDTSCTVPDDYEPSEPDDSYPDTCSGNFLMTECNEYVGQGLGYDCSRFTGATCGRRANDTEDVCIIPENGPCSGTRPLKCADGLFCNGSGRCQASSAGDGDGDVGDGDGDVGDGDGDGDTDAGPGGDGMTGCTCVTSDLSSSNTAGMFAVLFGLGVVMTRRRRRS